MSLLLRVSLLLLTLAPAACTRVGGSCNKEGFLCEDPETALECQDNTWVALPCRGPEGCTVEKVSRPCPRLPDGGTPDPATCPVSIVSCDTSRNVVGDACASSLSGKGLCSADGKAVLECRDGTFVETKTCSSCAVSSGQVVCQP